MLSQFHSSPAGSNYKAMKETVKGQINAGLAAIPEEHQQRLAAKSQEMADKYHSFVTSGRMEDVEKQLEPMDVVIVATVIFTLLCVAKTCCRRKQQFASQAANDKKNDPEHVRVVINEPAIPRNVESQETETDRREFVHKEIPSRPGFPYFIPPPMLQILPSLAAAATSARGGLSAQDEADMPLGSMLDLQTNSGEALSKWRNHFERVQGFGSRKDRKDPIKGSGANSEEGLSKPRGRYVVVDGKSPAWVVDPPKDMHQRGSRRA